MIDLLIFMAALGLALIIFGILGAAHMLIYKRPDHRMEYADFIIALQKEKNKG